MAELRWLRSSPVKAPTNGSLSSTPGAANSIVNGSNENLFDLLQQGRVGSSTDRSGGCSSIFGPSSSSDQNHGSPFFRPSDHQQQQQIINYDDDSTSLLKTEDENHLQSGTVEQMTIQGLQPNLWPVVDHTSSTSPSLLGALQGSNQHHHHGQQLYNNAHSVVPSLHHPNTGMVIDSCEFPSFPSLKPHDPSPQLQALRDFMAYGSNNNNLNANNIGGGHQHHAAQATNLAAGGLGVSPMFLHLGDDQTVGSSLLQQLPGMSPGGQMQQRTYVGENSSPIRGCKPADMLAYRALYQSELFATERSPHRTQFQRENHILAERQRREEMNEKFSALRAMIPKATKKDKASIVGDTIGYVLELEKTLKHLQACKASRKGYFKEFKLLKRKPSLKIAPEVVATEDDDLEDCDRSMTGTSSTPPDLDLQSNPTATVAAAEEMHTTDLCTLSEEHMNSHHQHSDVQQHQCVDMMDSFDGPVISLATENVNGCAEPFQEHEVKDDDGDMLQQILPPSQEGISSAEVDIQNLGEQAVIKIVCARSSGLVLRILLALDECKVDVLQSNVTSVAEKSVHFITVQICSGLSLTTEEMIAVLHKASSSPNR
ncbi:unnamed protein product [Calypogeia fissa]